MRKICRMAALAAPLLIVPMAAPAQDLGNLASSARDAASALKSAAEKKLLIADLIGAEVAGPTGDTIGTVDNLVAVPGGRIVAALVRPSDGGDPLPVPYAAVKVSQTGGTVKAQLSQSLEDLRGSGEVKALGEALGSIGGGQ